VGAACDGLRAPPAPLTSVVEDELVPVLPELHEGDDDVDQRPNAERGPRAESLKMPSPHDAYVVEVI
jgi:hypothetical protein